jgi:hypothetical protein
MDSDERLNEGGKGKMINSINSCYLFEEIYFSNLIII